MALAPAQLNERKRVKVYELRDADWCDRGTGFCIASTISDEARIFVQSEEDPSNDLLDVRVKKEESYQKQQDTLIVWTDPEGMDMALSFQEAEGCAIVSQLIREVQQRITDDPNDSVSGPPRLPPPELGNLHTIEDIVRRATGNPSNRDLLTKQIISEDYISKLTPLVEAAEDLEDLPDLHRLCNIMKHLILFNEQSIIEYVVRDEVILGVVGALEYDPDFPAHKANHRQYLSDASKYKEVVRIQDEDIRKKIHYTYRLQYLKDVVLARILDDPTFGVLNGLIFFHQYEIVTYIQNNTAFLNELFSIISNPTAPRQKKKEAVLFIQQSCAMAKNIQPPARGSWYQNLVSCGLFSTITYALHHPDASVRVAGTDILVSVIDHDAGLVRHHIIRAINENQRPLTETLVGLLLIETDLGVKAQLADAIKVLLDISPTGPNMLDSTGEMKKYAHNVANEIFINHFYEHSAKTLFKPMKDLEPRTSVHDLSIHEASLFGHLIDIMCFIIRQHGFKANYFVLGEALASRVAQLLQCPQKHIKLSAVKYFRTAISLFNEHYNRQMFQQELFEPLIALLEETAPRDNLLSSACLELFEFVRKEAVKPIIQHLAENYRDRLEAIPDVAVMPGIVRRYEQMMNPPPTEPSTGAGADSSFMTSEGGTPNTRHVTMNGANRWQTGLRELDADEEAYYNPSDGDEDEDELNREDHERITANGIVASPGHRPLVDYGEDEDEDELISSATSQTLPEAANKPSEVSAENSSPASSITEASPEVLTPSTAASNTPPPNKPALSQAEKRRREEDDDEDEFAKLASGIKRRNSVKGKQESSKDVDKPEDTASPPAHSEVHKKGNGDGKISISLGSSKPSEDKRKEIQS